MKYLALALAAALALSGCTQDSAEIEDIRVYFVSDTGVDLRLYSETQQFTGQGDNLALQVLSSLISGETQPADPDYVNLWDSSNSLISLEISGSLATVDLELGVLNVGAEGEARAIDQVLWTLNGIVPEVQAVQFLVEGKPVESLAGHMDTTVAIPKGEEFDVLSSVQISSLVDGASVTSPVTISGEACVFEANVAWTLLSGEKVVAEGSTLAKEACPTRSGWSVDLGELEPGKYKFIAYEISAKDGSVISKDDKQFSVN